MNQKDGTSERAKSVEHHVQMKEEVVSTCAPKEIMSDASHALSKKTTSQQKPQKYSRERIMGDPESEERRLMALNDQESRVMNGRTAATT